MAWSTTATASYPLVILTSPISPGSPVGAGILGSSDKDDRDALYHEYHREDITRRNGKEVA